MLPTEKSAVGVVRRIEIFLQPPVVVAFLNEEVPPLVFALVTTSLPPGDNYQWGYSGGLHRLNVIGRESLVIHFRGKKAHIDAFAEMVKQSPTPIPAAVFASTLQGAPAPSSGKSKEGEPVHALAGDAGVLAGNQALAELFIDFLARYAGIVVDRKQAINGLTADQVNAITAGNEKAQTVTRYFTQGWNEYKTATGGTDPVAFGIMEECLLTQWDRGNFTVLHNLLDIRKDSLGLGLYRRGTPLMYYTEFGEPVPAVGGGYRDPGFRAARPPSFALQIRITDRGLLQVFRAIQAVTVDEQILIYKSAKGYVDNRDLLWPAVRNGWDGFSEALRIVGDQLPVLVTFLGGHLVAKLLEQSPDPKAKLIGLAIDGILTVVGKVFNIVFVGELLVLAMTCGRELSLVLREEGKPLDALSQQHLGRAAIAMRQLLISAIAWGLTQAAFETTRLGAIILGTPPTGGGGLQPAFATSGAPGGAGAAAATGGPVPRPPGIPVLPSQMKSQGEEGGGSSVNKEAATGEKKETKTGGKKQIEPTEKRNETGEQKEKREMAEDRPQRVPKSGAYFDWEGGQRGSFRGFVRQLRAHIRSLTKSGQADPLPGLKEEVLGQNTEDFIKSKPALKKVWDGWTARLARQLNDIAAQRRAAAGDKRLQADLDRKAADLEADLKELELFAKGEVGNKRPDLIEMFFGENRAVITDVTQRVGDLVHNFKMQVYVEVMRSLTGYRDVGGLEYNTTREQKVIP